MKLHMRILIALMVVLSAPLQMMAAETEQGWPRKIEKGDATIIIYQPQVESLTENRMESRAAVSVTNGDYPDPVFGAMWFDCHISTDRDERTVRLIDLDVSAAKFPDLEEGHVEQLSSFLEKEIPSWEMELSLDQLLADLDMNETTLNLSEGLNNAPPEIIYRTTPSALILVDGDPIFEKIEKTNYERVVNTPFFIVRDTKKKEYFINGGEHWYRSDDAANWEYTSKVPGKLEQIAEEAMGESEPEEQTGQEAADEEAEPVVPEIILRTSPAELIQSDGEAEFTPIEGTSILYMSNTADDILMNIETQEYYILVSGRWYRSKSLSNGPWTFVEPDQVPSTFTEIPSDSDMGSVRSNIAGTQEAKEAMLENSIPQTAEVDRNEARLEVSYDGNPKFEPIEGTKMKYAVNTDKSVLLIENRYYCCDNAIWFESNSPSGPWVVSTVVPETVQEIPPESPVYNVKYVYIYDYSPSVVYVGYTPGYVHSYAYRGCVYYGTGYYYQPWYGSYYYPRPVTYGYNVHWNPYTGWGFSFGVSYGWMTYGWGSPYYGWWGPAGYRYGYHYGYHYGYNSGYRSGYRAGYYAGQRTSAGRPTPYGNQLASNNIYNSRSQGVRRSGNSTYDPRTGNRVSTADRTGRPTAQPANRDNNVYADREGNVYRRDGESWDRVDNSSRPQNRDQPSTRPTQPDARPSQPSTRPTQPDARPSQPSTRPTQPDARPSQPSTQPSTRPTQPSTRPTQPSTQPSTRPSQPSTQPSTRPSQPSNSYTRPGSAPNTNNLNRDYNSRNRGAERSQQYNQNKPSYQYSRPSTSPASRPSPSARPSTSPSRSGGAQPSTGARRR
jgi:hypothetical protein